MTESVTPEETSAEERTEEVTEEQTEEVTAPVTEEPVVVIPTITLNELPENGDSVFLFGIDEQDENVQIIMDTLRTYPHAFSFSAYSIDGTKAMAYNTIHSYFSACTVKAGYALHCCLMLDAGKESKDTELEYTSINYRIGSGKIKKSPYGTKYTIEYLINQSLFISDNVAYDMLKRHFGTGTYNALVTSIGADSLKLRDTSLWAQAKPNDLVRMWYRIYEYLVSNNEHVSVMREACTNSLYAYGVEMLSGIDYSHKSGDNYEPNAAEHDAGIVWLEDGPYIYCFMNNTEGKGEDGKVITTVMSALHTIFGAGEYVQTSPDNTVRDK